MTTIEIIDFALQVITALAIIAAAIQIFISRKQLYLSTITKCIGEFRDLGPLNKTTNDQHTVVRYLDLTNEELFYFQQNYIPKEVTIEWIDGMIDFMPVADRSGKVLNAEHAIQYLVDNRETAFINYPRIQNAFEVDGQYDWPLIYSADPAVRMRRASERKKLIKEIQANIKRFDWFS